MAAHTPNWEQLTQQNSTQKKQLQIRIINELTLISSLYGASSPEPTARSQYPSPEGANLNSQGGSATVA